jgi:hypothetical protein
MISFDKGDPMIKKKKARKLLAKPVLLATWETEIRRIEVLGQPGQMVSETPISKITVAR